MKHLTFKWLKRLYILIAVKLVIVALLLTSARILFISVADYKQQAIDWLTTEYQVNIAVEDITAGIDFSGMVLILNNVELLDSSELPFVLNFEYLFLHLDFWDSVTTQQLTFNRITLQGANLTLNKASGKNRSKESQLTIDKLKDIFLTQLKKVSVKNSTLNYTDKFGIDKEIVIEQLRWLNEGKNHQGIGQASFPHALGENSLKFVVDVFSERGNPALAGNVYLQADDLNITEYLSAQVNSNAKILEAVVGFDVWASFSDNKVDSVQVEFTKNQFSWTQLGKNYNWGLNAGSLQVTNSKNGWLLDSYDLAITHNNVASDDYRITAQGDRSKALVDVEGLTVKDILPVYLLHSELSEEQILSLNKFDLDANITQFGLSLDSENEFQFSLKANQFKNRPVGGIPGISNANITLQGGIKSGRADLKFNKQKIYFDGQFSRSMPLKSAVLDLQWQQTETGLKLFSEQASIITDELDTISEFALFLPNEKAQNDSAFLSLYSYVNLNDASKARHYFPIKGMGKKTYAYLEPTIQKGHVKGAKILWYGAFNHFPYAQKNGVFQAWVPIRDAQYDFYGDWQGLTNLDLDLLFENDYLLMDAKKGNLGAVNAAKLTGEIDHLSPRGVLTIKANISDDADKISDYLKASPLKNSVGKALTAIEVSKPLAGNLTLTIPFDRSKQGTQIAGDVFFKNNNLKINLADNLMMPLEKVNGSFKFDNGNLVASDIDAVLFQQPVALAFKTQQRSTSYQIDAQVNGLWNVDALNRYHRALAPLQTSGALDWSSTINFTQHYQGGYQYNVDLESALQGMSSHLPAPFYKHELESWPTSINVSGDSASSRVKASIEDKLAFDGVLEYQHGTHQIPYFNLTVGLSDIMYLDKSKQVINVKLDNLNITNWHNYWQTLTFSEQQAEVQEDGALATLALDEVKIDVEQLSVFGQPLAAFQSRTSKHNGKWDTTVSSDSLKMQLEYRPGTPVRYDIKAEKVNLQSLDLNLINNQSFVAQSSLRIMSENLLDDYPELFVDCEVCVYKNLDLSPLSLHIYPTKKRLNIDYIKVGNETEFAKVAGFWDQRLTNIIFDIEGDKDLDVVKRLGYVSPVYFHKAQVSGALNWVGAPWKANLNTLNGALSAQLTDGTITEVSDKGTRLLSVFSLDGIHRSLNLEFDNVFEKGFSFDKISFSGNINDGIASNDDFYLSGSAGKIIGSGLVDLPNQVTNYNFSYSPAVTSSLPLLAAFTINPLTGAAVLMITKLLEPVVDTIIRVDFSVKGDLAKPEVKLVTRQRGQIKLDNSEVLQEMTEHQQQSFEGNFDDSFEDNVEDHSKGSFNNSFDDSFEDH